MTPDFKKRAEEAADEYATTHSVFTKEMHGNIVHDFLAGAEWRDAQQAAEVARLRAALEKLTASAAESGLATLDLIEALEGKESL